MLVKEIIVKILNRVFRLFGLSVVSEQSLLMAYQHDYGPGGYDKYKETQIFHNKRKIDQTWADSKIIGAISDYIKQHVDPVEAGICHGTRRGYEQEEFSKLLNCPVIGTEISDTAEQFPATVQWDFHEQKDEWRDSFSFVYSNALDQAFNPQKALSTWADQLKQDGLLFIEHSMLHAAGGASAMDPFGAHPMAMPYLFFQWGRGEYQLVDVLELVHERKIDIWIFVIGRWGRQVDT